MSFIFNQACYVALLGLAENSFKSLNARAGIKCIEAIFRFQLPPNIEARTHLQFGVKLLQFTLNTELAKQHIEQAWRMCMQLVQPDLDDVRFESASTLSFILEEQGQWIQAQQILQKAIEMSPQSPYWHCRLLFQLANIQSFEKDYVSAVATLSAGVEYAGLARIHYTQMLFFLSKAMLLLLERKFADANPILHQAGPSIENWIHHGHSAEVVKESLLYQQKENLQLFFLVLQVFYYLMVGQVKSVKGVLKQLQQSIQTISSADWPSDEEMTSLNPAINFQWLSKEHICILVYLVTVMHSMQAGYMDKAQKYTDKALLQIEKLKVATAVSMSCIVKLESSKPRSILTTFHVLLLEHVVQCRIVTGNNSGAITELGHLSQLLNGNAILIHRHGAQMHTLLGLYAMTTNSLDLAEAQFNAALRNSQERELWTFVNLNLAVVFLRGRGRENELALLLERVQPEKLPTQSHCLRAAAFYIQGLQAFFASRFNDSKRFLRETLKMANAEDLNRLTSCSLVLLGHIFLSLGNSREAMNMVTPAMQLASKIPDVHVQVWASSILKDLYRLSRDYVREQEGLQIHANYSQLLAQDHARAALLPEHVLLRWIDDSQPLPDIKMRPKEEAN